VLLGQAGMVDSDLPAISAACFGLMHSSLSNGSQDWATLELREPQHWHLGFRVKAFPQIKG
jgi:hypothetical protein